MLVPMVKSDSEVIVNCLDLPKIGQIFDKFLFSEFTAIIFEKKCLSKHYFFTTYHRLCQTPIQNFGSRLGNRS